MNILYTAYCSKIPQNETEEGSFLLEIAEQKFPVFVSENVS